MHTPGSLAAEFMKLINYNDALATTALKVLDIYFFLWKCYVINSQVCREDTTRGRAATASIVK